MLVDSSGLSVGPSLFQASGSSRVLPGFQDFSVFYTILKEVELVGMCKLMGKDSFVVLTFTHLRCDFASVLQNDGVSPAIGKL